MSVSYAPSKLRIPVGFEHLLEALAREVLREQPKDIIKFAAEYFRRKLILRDEGTLRDNVPVVQKSTTTVSEAAPLKRPQSDGEEHVVNEKPSDDIMDIDLHDPELEKAASTIQAHFRSHLKKEESKKNEVDTQPVVTDQSEMLNQTPDVLPDLDLGDPELNKAASVIQANFRTYLSKKNKMEEQTESRKEAEGTGPKGDTEPATSPAELTKIESKEKTSVEMEESKEDDRPAEVEEEPKSKEDVAESDGDPLPGNQERVTREGGTKDVSTPPAADDEKSPETVESGVGGASGPQLEEENSPGKVEDAKIDEEGSVSGDAEPSPAGEGDDVEDTTTECVQKAQATGGDGEYQEALDREDDEPGEDPKAKSEPSDDVS